MTDPDLSLFSEPQAEIDTEEIDKKLYIVWGSGRRERKLRHFSGPAVPQKPDE